jgi:hypothetical protein
MAKFEVHIPATDANGFNVTLKVGAENWMSALKAGLQKLGEQGTISQNVMVDIQEDNSIHVTEAASGRVFRIRELTEEEVAKAQVKRPSQIRPPPAAAGPVPAVTEVPAAKTEPGLPTLKGDSAKTQPLPPAPARGNEITAQGGEPLKIAPPAVDMNKTLPGGPPPAALAALRAPPQQVKSSPRIEVRDVEELVQPVKPTTGAIGRAKSTPNVARSMRQETEDILADVFLRVVEISDKKSREDAMQFILDLAMEKVPCEAGSVLYADLATGDLTFAVARGPKAAELLRSKIVVPAGEGLAGFCSSEGVSVAVSDAEKDPRFYAEVGEKLGYATRSLLCAPMMTHGHSFGCVQLINRKGGPQFLEHEVGVLAYLAHQGALYLNDKLLR